MHRRAIARDHRFLIAIRNRTIPSRSSTIDRSFRRRVLHVTSFAFFLVAGHLDQRFDACVIDDANGMTSLFAIRIAVSLIDAMIEIR